MPDLDRQRQLARDRKRRQRARERVGLSLYVVRLDGVLVEDGLTAAGLLPEARADDREAASAIFARVLAKWLGKAADTRDAAPAKVRVHAEAGTYGRERGGDFGPTTKPEVEP